ncbi:MAG UNVERIFIED_CONTAM: hypothetical protein LVT10_25065 [Anaerolineae bacterium]
MARVEGAGTQPWVWACRQSYSVTNSVDDVCRGIIAWGRIEQGCQVGYMRAF